MRASRRLKTALIAGVWPLFGADAAPPVDRISGAAVHSSELADASDDSVAGRTLDEWRALIKSLELTSPAAAEAVPGLITLCRTRQVPEATRMQAAYTLGRIGAPAEAAIPTLVALLEPTSAGVANAASSSTARWAAKALGLFGSRAAEATPALIRAATSAAVDPIDDLAIRLAATEALGRIGGAHPDAIPALMQLSAAAPQQRTSDFDRQRLRAAAIDGLALIGAPAASAVPMLIRLTLEDASDLRKRSAQALGAMGPAAGIATEALVDLVLFDEMPEVRDAAITALAAIGEAGEAALAQLLQDEEVDVRRRAAGGLAGMLRPPSTSQPALVAALEDSHVDVRLEAVAALLRTDQDRSPLVDVLLEGLQVPERLPRIRAYRLLVTLRDQRALLLPRLESLARDKRSHVRQAAGKALAELQDDNTGAPVP